VNIPQPTPQITQAATPSLTPAFPNLQAELLDERNKTTISPIGKFDFKNYIYDLPRGWQNPDGTAEVTLVNGRVEPVDRPIKENMSDEQKAAAKAQRRIGLTYVTTKYFDLTRDGQDEAAVILKIETGGAAVPQLVYIYEWKNGGPSLLYSFRTGDRTDGGLKDVRAENGDLVVELYGQDRFLLGGVESGKITGDEEQLCCPIFFTRTLYKWNGTSFLMQGKRLTYSLAMPALPPQVNLGDVVNDPKNQKTKK
jgi:hypothetical protein